MRKRYLVVFGLLFIAILSLGFVVHNRKVTKLERKLKSAETERDSLLYQQLRTQLYDRLDTPTDTMAVMKKVAILRADSVANEHLQGIIEELRGLPYNNIALIDKFVEFLEAERNLNKRVVEVVVLTE